MRAVVVPAPDPRHFEVTKIVFVDLILVASSEYPRRQRSDNAIRHMASRVRPGLAPLPVTVRATAARHTNIRAGMPRETPVFKGVSFHSDSSTRHNDNPASIVYASNSF
ncbi:MAG: hypothetical protein Ct9H300mP25_15040 [Acidobacteriota bacterium]|nr:MAG: hypothetical protein Ct9H300mP25_15040 [Acidobacteriota bacterium]